MDEELYNWLEKDFKFNNIKKYHKYFKEWVSNLTDIQIFYLKKQRFDVINETLIQH